MDHHGYLCEQHANLAWGRIEWRDTDRCHAEIPYAEARNYVRTEARAKRTAERRKPASMGQIYYVRVDGLVKVGWTTKLADRVRAYGPKAELVVNYPGTRADEAALHRQLTPARFRGREWYSDNDVIQMFIAQALEKYGPPRFQRIDWTEAPRQNIKPRRSR